MLIQTLIPNPILGQLFLQLHLYLLLIPCIACVRNWQYGIICSAQLAIWDVALKCGLLDNYYH